VISCGHGIYPLPPSEVVFSVVSDLNPVHFLFFPPVLKISGVLWAITVLAYPSLVSEQFYERFSPPSFASASLKLII